MGIDKLREKVFTLFFYFVLKKMEKKYIYISFYLFTIFRRNLMQTKINEQLKNTYPDIYLELNFQSVFYVKINKFQCSFI